PRAAAPLRGERGSRTPTAPERSAAPPAREGADDSPFGPLPAPLPAAPPQGPAYLGVALRSSLERGRGSILCRLTPGARPAAVFRELATTQAILDAVTSEEALAVVAVAAPLWLPGEGIARNIAAREGDDPELWVARPWTRSPFVSALGFARVEL